MVELVLLLYKVRDRLEMSASQPIVRLAAEGVIPAAKNKKGVQCIKLKK